MVVADAQQSISGLPDSLGLGVQPNIFEFTDFNLSIKQSQQFEESRKTPEGTKYYHKPLTLFFKTTKEISKTNFDVFVPARNLEEGQIGSEKISFEISEDKNSTIKVKDNLNFNLVKIQKEENLLKVILGRPIEDIKNPIKAKDGLSIEFMALMVDMASNKISLTAEEKMIGDFIYTTFTVAKDEESLNLYDALAKEGLFSITLNGEKGIIGTYGFYIVASEICNSIYSDKLLSIPFGATQNVEQVKVEQNLEQTKSDQSLVLGNLDLIAEQAKIDKIDEQEKSNQNLEQQGSNQKVEQQGLNQKVEQQGLNQKVKQKKSKSSTTIINIIIAVVAVVVLGLLIFLRILLRKQGKF